MKNSIICFLVFLCALSANGQQWSNPENQMLSDSLSSFMFYSTNRPVPFSDPNSLKDTNKRAAASDYYHDESDQMLAYSRQQKRMRQLQQLQSQQMYNNTYNRRYGRYGNTINYNIYNLDNGQQNIIMGYQNNFDGSIIPYP